MNTERSHVLCVQVTIAMRSTVPELRTCHTRNCVIKELSVSEDNFVEQLNTLARVSNPSPTQSYLIPETLILTHSNELI